MATAPVVPQGKTTQTHVSTAQIMGDTWLVGSGATAMAVKHLSPGHSSKKHPQQVLERKKAMRESMRGV